MGNGTPAVAAGRRRIFPDDARQALRLRRFLVAAATAMLVPAALSVAYWLDGIALAVVFECSALISGLIVFFFVLFRSGLNLRFADPSLTAEMIGASILLLAWIMYEAPLARGPLALIYLVALPFGVLRLETRNLLALALLALGAHVAVVLFTFIRDPGMDLRAAAIELFVLFAVLPWFAFMGGYVNKLRHRFSDSNRQLTEAYGRIEQIAIRDELTGVFNRRLLMDALAREHSRSKRLNASYSVCLFDLDHFKTINDSWGHAAGDAVLKHFALIASSDLREIDVFGRYGGEEFLLILPDTAQRGAAAAAERVRAGVLAADFPQVPAGHRVTVTAGVATSRADEGTVALLARADRGLYEGKAAGRNRVVAVG